VILFSYSSGIPALYFTGIPTYIFLLTLIKKDFKYIEKVKILRRKNNTAYGNS